LPAPGCARQWQGGEIPFEDKPTARAKVAGMSEALPSFFNSYDGPEILPSSTRPFCLAGADAGHPLTGRAWMVEVGAER